MITTKTQREVLAACVTKKSVTDLLEYVPEKEFEEEEMEL